MRLPTDLANTVNAINVTLFSKLNYDFIRDIASVASLDREPNVIVLHPSVPIATIPEFISFLKANAGTVNIGSAGYGATSHTASELLRGEHPSSTVRATP